jgi:GH25 family lysozyme M1 (1,4-beta-N-acetylmuramidase)
MSTFYGIDISNNNGNVNLAQVKAAGYPFVYIKATQGQTFKDKYMETYYNDCKDLQLKVGAYHFLVSTSTPEAQAQNFYDMIKDYHWDLVPMMDVETIEGFNAESLCDYVERFIAKFNQLSTLRLGIYTYTSFIENLIGCKDVIKDMPFWEANYGRSVWRLNDTWFSF